MSFSTKIAWVHRTKQQSPPIADQSSSWVLIHGLPVPAAHPKKIRLRTIHVPRVNLKPSGRLSYHRLNVTNELTHQREIGIVLWSGSERDLTVTICGNQCGMRCSDKNGT